VLLIGSSLDLRAGTAMAVSLGSNRVVEALHDAGISARPSEVEFLASVPVTAPDVALRISGWRKLDSGTFWVRLTCRHTQDCLPFFILLHPSDPSIVPSFPVLPESDIHPAFVKKVRKPLLVRAGSRATLLLQSGPARITTPVLCLDNGALGNRIRVKNPATKQILSAEIVGRGLVQAWF
jgi:hypothetical protein